jgi:hypothetical protein
MARRPARVCPATYSTLYIVTRFRVGVVALDQYLLENVYYAIVEEENLMFCAGVLLASAAAVTAHRNKLPVQFTGEGCLKDDDQDKGQTYRFGSCLPTHKSSDHG